MKRICVYGAGAIGGFLAVLLAESGHEISLVDTGEQLAAIQQDGLTLQHWPEAGNQINRQFACTDRPTELGQQDLIIVAVKTYSLVDIAPNLAPLMSKHSTVLFANNGIPWWYTYKLGGELEGKQLQSVDPDGNLRQSINPDQVLGCVIYPACEIVSPGIIKFCSGDRVSLGELDGSISERGKQVAALLTDVGLKARLKKRIRDEVWLKLWGNLSLNPISVLTGANLDQICQHTSTKELARNMMLEAQSVAESLGIKFPLSAEKRLDGAAAVGAHKTSMLLDYEHQRQLETDALITVVVELARLQGIETPTIEAVLALLSLKEDVSN